MPHPLMMILMKKAVKQVVREGGGWPHLVNPTDPALSGVQAANLVLATGLRTRTCLIIIIIIIIVVIIIITIRNSQLGSCNRFEGSLLLKASRGRGVHLYPGLKTRMCLIIMMVMVMKTRMGIKMNMIKVLVRS